MVQQRLMAHILVQRQERRRPLVLGLVLVIGPETFFPLAGAGAAVVRLHEAVARAADEDEVFGHEVEVLGAVPVIQCLFFAGGGGDADGDDAGSFGGAGGAAGGFVALDEGVAFEVGA